MDDFSVHDGSFNVCLDHLTLVFQRCDDRDKFDIELGEMSLYDGGQRCN